MKALSVALAFLSSLGAAAQYGNHNPIFSPVPDPVAVIAMDVDGDGDKDVVGTADYDDRILWFENLGGGSFGPEQIISTDVGGLKSVFAIDLDGDLDEDLISASDSGGIVAWYENLGGGNFGPQQVIAAGLPDLEDVYATDLNGDGDNEVLSASSAPIAVDRIIWYENFGGGVFGSPQVVSTQYSSKNITTGDLDGDGFQDIIIDGGRWFENLGGGFSGASQLYAPAGTIGFGFPLDIDSDGDVDVFSAAANSVVWFENLGGGVFGPEQIVTNQIALLGSLDAADIDGDGDFDLVSASLFESKIAWYPYLGGGSFGPQQVIEVDETVGGFAIISDLDADGNVDVVSASKGADRIGWYKNLGGGVFDPFQSLSNQPFAMDEIATADLDGDGDLDIIIGSWNFHATTWQANLGNGEFGPLQFISDSLRYVTTIYTTDIDNDGDVDIFLADGPNNLIVWHENLGGGSFAPQEVVTALVDYPSSLFAADLDGDGFKDLITASRDDNNVRWHKNLGNGSFALWASVGSSVAGAKSVYAGDFDQDGDIDVVAAAHDVHQVRLYKNYNNATGFTATIIASNVTYVSIVTGADVDSDGDLDVAWASFANDLIGWSENLGGGVFGPMLFTTSAATDVEQLYVDDVDGDGDMDFVSSCAGYAFAICENLGGQSFGAIQKIQRPANLPAYTNNYKVRLADFDGDGDNEVLSSTPAISQLGWYMNYTFGQVDVTGRIYIDINQNGLLDSLDFGIPQVSVQATPQSDFTWSFSDGSYEMFFTDALASYVLAPPPLTHWSIVSDSLTYLITIDSLSTIRDSIDFGYYPDSIVDEVTLDLTTGLARCSTVVNWWLTAENTGTTMPSGIIHVELDTAITFYTATPAPDSVMGQHIYWSYDSLAYFGQFNVDLQVMMPNFQSAGDSLHSHFSIAVLDSLGNLSSVQDSITEVVRCAYDPNDKQVSPTGLDSMGYILPSIEMLEYTVRFQNTGNDTAFNITVVDQLDVSLDWQTLNPISSSHPMTISVDQNGEASFSFLNILLPDSVVDEVGSHGFFKYQIALKPNLAFGTSIHNTAHIFFDFNPAVITNTPINTLYDCNAITHTLSSTTVCAADTFTATVVDAINSTIFTWDLAGQQGSASTFSWVADTSGTFDLTITASNTMCTKDTVVQVIVLQQLQSQIVDSIEICAGDSIILFGQFQMQQGVYYQTLQTVYGCDSVVGKRLELYPIVPVQLIDSTTVCSGDTVQIFGQPATQAGLYYNTLTSNNGCDSILAWQVIFYPTLPTQTLDTTLICAGDSALIFGQYQTQAALYYNTLQSINGCDSIVAKQLDFHPTISTQILDTTLICTGDSALIFGQYQTQAALYYNTLQSANGCDSIVAKQLDFHPTIPTQTLDTTLICIGDSALIFGQYQTQATVYYNTLQSVHGCDSTVGKQLEVAPLPTITMGTISEDTICIESGVINLPNSLPAGGSYSGVGVSGSTFDPAIAGVGSHDIWYTFTDNDGCSSLDSIQIGVRICAGIATLSANSVVVYPNPFSESTLVSFDRPLNGQYSIKLYNVLGEEVMSIEKIVGTECSIEKRGLANGIFTLVIVNDSSQSVEFSTKLVVQ